MYYLERKNHERFENKVAIVTGGGDGIGYGISERLSREGANVMIVDFNAEIASQSVSDLDSKIQVPSN